MASRSFEVKLSSSLYEPSAVVITPPILNDIEFPLSIKRLFICSLIVRLGLVAV